MTCCDISKSTTVCTQRSSCKNTYGGMVQKLPQQKQKERSSRPLMFNFRPQKVTTLAGRSLSYFPTRKRKGEVVIIYTRMVYAKIFHGGMVLLSGGGVAYPRIPSQLEYRMYGTGNKNNKLWRRITIILVQIVNVIFVVAFQRQYQVNVRFYFYRLG